MCFRILGDHMGGIVCFAHKSWFESNPIRFVCCLGFIWVVVQDNLKYTSIKQRCAAGTTIYPLSRFCCSIDFENVVIKFLAEAFTHSNKLHVWKKYFLVQDRYLF